MGSILQTPGANTVANPFKWKVVTSTFGAHRTAALSAENFALLRQKRFHGSRNVAVREVQHEHLPSLPQTVRLDSQDSWYDVVAEVLLLQNVCRQLREGVPGAGATKTVCYLARSPWIAAPVVPRFGRTISSTLQRGLLKQFWRSIFSNR